MNHNQPFTPRNLIVIIALCIHNKQQDGGSLSTATIASLIISFDYVHVLHELLSAASAVVEVLDVPHFAIGGWVHNEVAHIWTGCG